MQNSAVMAIRATVLLVCLIAVPVVAICGKNAPDVVKSLIRDFTSSPAKVAPTSTGSSDAPVFRPGLMGPPASSPAEDSTAALSPAPKAAPKAAALSHSLDVRTAGADIASTGPAIATIAHQVDVSGPGPDRQAMSDSRPNESNAVHFPPDYFRSAETRLRALGATYYLLETLGPTGDQYRFVCKVATGSQPEQILAFFAVDRDPLAAMNQVVRQVEGSRLHLDR
ncbi:MAG: hypothetical protein WD894_12615 [Pirellulales bacterium]